MKSRTKIKSKEIKYRNMLINQEEEIFQLRKKFSSLIKKILIVFLVTLILCAGVSTFMLEIGKIIGEQKGIDSSFTGCVTYLCENGVCHGWAEYDDVVETCNKLITHKPSSKFSGKIWFEKR